MQLNPAKLPTLLWKIFKHMFPNCSHLCVIFDISKFNCYFTYRFLNFCLKSWYTLRGIKKVKCSLSSVVFSEKNSHNLSCKEIFSKRPVSTLRHFLFLEWPKEIDSDGGLPKLVCHHLHISCMDWIDNVVQSRTKWRSRHSVLMCVLTFPIPSLGVSVG